MFSVLDTPSTHRKKRGEPMKIVWVPVQRQRAPTASMEALRKVRASEVLDGWKVVCQRAKELRAITMECRQFKVVKEGCAKKLITIPEKHR